MTILQGSVASGGKVVVISGGASPEGTTSPARSGESGGSSPGPVWRERSQLVV